MTNLTEKIDELQLQLATQHNAMMVALNALVADSTYIKSFTAETASRVAVTNNTLAFMRDNQLTYLATIDTQLYAIFTRLADVKAATENSAVSGNGNNSILLSLDGRFMTANAHLATIADCSCNDGQATPVSSVCQGDYQRTTLASGIQGDFDSYCLFYENNVENQVRQSYLADMDVNTYQSVTYNGRKYSTNRANIIPVDVGTVWCVENTGTALFQVAIAYESSFFTEWQFTDVLPGAMTTIAVAQTNGRKSFTIVSRIDKKEDPDGFKARLYRAGYIYTPPTGLTLTSEPATVVDSAGTPYANHLIVWPIALGTPKIARGDGVTANLPVWLDPSRAYIMTMSAANIIVEGTGVTQNGLVVTVAANATNVIFYRLLNLGSFTILVE